MSIEKSDRSSDIASKVLKHYENYVLSKYSDAKDYWPVISGCDYKIGHYSDYWIFIYVHTGSNIYGFKYFNEVSPKFIGTNQITPNNTLPIRVKFENHYRLKKEDTVFIVKKDMSNLDSECAAAMQKHELALGLVPKATPEDKKESMEKGGVLEPKPPEFLQNLLWILKYGIKHWKIILLAIVLLFIWGIFVWPKFDFLSKFYHPTKKEALNDYGRTTNQELKAKKKEIEASTETNRPHTIKEVQSKQFQVQVGKAYSDPKLELIVGVKEVHVDYTADLNLTFPGCKPITEKNAAPSKSWDFQIAGTQYKLVVVEINYIRSIVSLELSQIIYEQAKK